jgi:predicted XRE-type DNA-binding protein
LNTALRKSVGQPRRGGVSSLNAADRSYASSDDGSSKAKLASKLNDLLDQSGLSQSTAADVLGMPQSKVSAIRNYKLRGISLERLLQALVALDQQVEISVKPCSKTRAGSIKIAL